MMPSLLRFFLTLVLHTVAASSSECNNSKAVPLDGMCFIYDSAASDWFKAKETCASFGMYLATIRSPEQMEHIMKAISPGTPLDTWLGGNDLDNEGRFVWDEDKRPIVEEFWNRKKDDSELGDSDCVYINNDLRLNEALCSEMRSSLCMYRMPTPAFYFGENNSYICHCKEGACDKKGYCSSSQGRCATGWFGDGCQFRSLSGGRYGPLGTLGDNDDQTCTSDIKLPLTIKLKAGSIFRSIRLTMEKQTSIQGLQLYFNWNQMKMKCTNIKLLSTRSVKSKDVECEDGPDKVDDIIISWTGDISLCSIDVNGEQNFALLQSTSVPGVTDDSISLPVDGRRGPYDSCYEGHPSVGSQTWTLTFTRPKIIHEIIIYRKPKIKGYTHMNGFCVQGYKKDGLLQFRYQDNGQNANSSAVIIITHTRSILTETLKIVISIDDASESRHLELCEVEAYGACDPPDKGIHCIDVCDRETCIDGVCVGNNCERCLFGVSPNGYCLTSNRMPCKEADKIWIKLLIGIVFILFIVAVLMIIYIINEKPANGQSQQARMNEASIPKKDDDVQSLQKDGDVQSLPEVKSSHSQPV